MATVFSDKNISSIKINGEKYNIKSIPFQNPDGEYIPKEGEIVIETDDLGTGYTECYLKVGDGINNVATLPNATAPPMIGLTTGDQYFRVTPSQVASALQRGSNAIVIHADEELGVLLGFSGFCGSFDSNFPFIVAETSVDIEGLSYTFRLTGNYTTNKWSFQSIENSPTMSQAEIQAYINSQIASAGHLKRVILGEDEELPSVDEADENTIYMKKSAEYHLIADVYDEYMVIDGSWEIIGNTRVDLSEYLKTVTTGIGLKATKEANNAHIEIDSEVVFILNCGTSTELID